eukprot:277578_1
MAAEWNRKITIALEYTDSQYCYQYTLTTTEKELDYAKQTSRDPTNPTFFNIDGCDAIQSWDDYAQSASANRSRCGKVYEHFHYLTANLLTISDLSSFCNCIHNTFDGGVHECVQRLRQVFYGTMADFNLFAKNQLCHECILFVLSNMNMHKLLCDYCTSYRVLFSDQTIFPTEFTRCKELLYFSNCFLKYRTAIRYIINDVKLYKQLFLLLIHYFQQFTQIKHYFNDSNPMFMNLSEHKYVIYKVGIAALCDWEYNFIGVLSCIKPLMPYFKCIHLKALMSMNYFVCFKTFIDEYLELSYLKLIVKTIQPPKPSGVDTTSCFSMDILLSINGFVSELIWQKFHSNRSELNESNTMRLNFEKMLKLRYKTLIIANHFPLFFDHKQQLKDEYKYDYMCCLVSIQPHMNVTAIFSHKTKQRRKQKRCGHCNRYAKQLKLCVQCKLTYYSKTYDKPAPNQCSSLAVDYKRGFALS